MTRHCRSQAAAAAGRPDRLNLAVAAAGHNYASGGACDGGGAGGAFGAVGGGDGSNADDASCSDAPLVARSDVLPDHMVPGRWQPVDLASQFALESFPSLGVRGLPGLSERPIVEMGQQHDSAGHWCERAANHDGHKWTRSAVLVARLARAPDEPH